MYGYLGQLLLVGLSLANETDPHSVKNIQQVAIEAGYGKVYLTDIMGEGPANPINAAIDVSGTVTSSVGETIPGVNILVKGTLTGTVTDIDGNYAITVPNEGDILVFSSIGYITQEVEVNGRAVIDVTMEEDVQGLEEVVVVGYGTHKKVNVIGSVTTIGSEELTAAPVSTISNALAGRLPGAIVQQSSGEPGNDQANILIFGSSTLGNNAPLIVMQGPVQAWNVGYTGFLMKKMMDHEVIGRDEFNENVRISLRYAEVIMNYAESSLGLGETQEAARYINMIRNRAAMPDFIGDIEKALRYEREIEFTFKNIRWFDIRRWKILEEELVDAKGVEITEITNLENETITTTWRRLIVQERNVEQKIVLDTYSK